MRGSSSWSIIAFVDSLFLLRGESWCLARRSAIMMPGTVCASVDSECCHEADVFVEGSLKILASSKAEGWGLALVVVGGNQLVALPG